SSRSNNSKDENNNQDIRAQKALKRTLKEAFIFNNIYQADLMEKMNKKGKAVERPDHSQSQPHPQLRKIKEEDGLFIEGLKESVGAHIKKSAVSLYDSYYQDNNAKPTITLGLNSILDLSYSYPDSQSVLFAPAQWKKLRNLLKIHKVTKPITMNHKVESMLTKAEAMAKTDLQKASDVIYNHLYKYKAKLCQDEAFILYVHAFISEFLVHNQYMFDKNIEKNEQDCIVKFWGPLMEKLIQKTGLRLNWSESSCSVIPNHLRADVGVIYDNQEDNQQIEARRISPSRQKFDFDHTKLLVETKDIIDSLIDSVNKEVCCIQFCGLELYKYSLKHQYNTLYVNNQVDHQSIPPAVVNFKFMRSLCAILLETRNDWIKLQEHTIITKQSHKAAYPARSDQKQQDMPVVKSPSWYPPRPNQKASPLMAIPPNLQ
ncbi:hypothetical protein INT47_012592, partial [Mucor saturninus]